MRTVTEIGKVFADCFKGNQYYRSQYANTQIKSGMFGIQHLSEPQLLRERAQRTLTRCRLVVDDIVTGGDADDGPDYVAKQMDTLSDMLCSVVDPCEFIRSSHWDDRWVSSASDAFSLLGDFMHELNTNTGMYLQLKQSKPQSLEALRVTKLLLNDFERNGVAKSPSERQQIVDLNTSIAQLGHQLSTSDSLSQRHQALNEMLAQRHLLSQQVGYESYVEMHICDKMAKSPANVRQFLEQIQKSSSDNQNYLDAVKQSSKYNLGCVMSALTSLFRLVYQIDLQPAEYATGELWGDRVIKCVAMDVSGAQPVKCGTVYFDLFRLQDGSNGAGAAAQFTIRCSRRIDNDEAGCFGPVHYGDLERGGASQLNGKRKQLPAVVLSCSFGQQSRQQQCLLTWQQVETLAHEFGHAMHSMIARTDYQHVAGTRCSLDFVEMPSVLMEYFVNSRVFVDAVVSGKSIESILTRPGAMEQLHHASQNGIYCYRNAKDAKLEIQQQLFYAKLDLECHGAHQSQQVDSDQIYADLWYRHYQLRARNMRQHPQCNFTHLYSYGAGYYSYLWSRSIAHQVFKHLFTSTDKTLQAADIWQRGGQTLRQEVLRHGNSIPPNEMNWQAVTGHEELNRI